jgi:hypothetical protein
MSNDGINENNENHKNLITMSDEPCRNPIKSSEKSFDGSTSSEIFVI